VEGAKEGQPKTLEIIHVLYGERICPVCKKGFMSTMKRRVYCSDSCAKIARAVSVTRAQYKFAKKLLHSIQTEGEEKQ